MRKFLSMLLLAFVLLVTGCSNENTTTTAAKTTTKKVTTEIKNKTPYEMHGALKVDGNQLVDKNDKPYQFQGISTHGIAWYPSYISESSFSFIKDEFNSSCIRLALYTSEYGGYCMDDGNNQVKLKSYVEKGINIATNLGLYVIIDWHILSDGNPNTYKDEAKEFFDYISEEYKDNDNILYELCNEPNSGTTWEEIKSYAEEVIPVIRNNDSNAICIVGTPNWSQQVDKAVANPITNYDNIMYSLHFYADTHKDYLRNAMVDAFEKGLPIIVTEFGLCDSGGNGKNNLEEAKKWLSLLDENKISYVIWNLSNKQETCALIKSSCTKIEGFVVDDLSEAGLWYYNWLNRSSL